MIQIGTTVVVACNSEAGVRFAQVICVYDKGSSKRRLRCADLGDRVRVSLKTGPRGVRGTMREATVIRTRKITKRKDGRTIMFEDNAVAILVEEMFRGTELKGVCAVEACKRFPTLLGKGAGVR